MFDVVPPGASPVVPAATDAGVPTDLLAHLVAERDGPRDTLTVTHVIEGGGPSRGSLRSLAGIAGLARGGRRSSVRLPGGGPELETVAFPLTEAVTVPRHVRVGRVDGFVSAAVAELLDNPPEPAVIAMLPEGPAEPDRRAQRFTYLVGDAVVQGFDTYGTTARGDGQTGAPWLPHRPSTPLISWTS